MSSKRILSIGMLAAGTALATTAAVSFPGYGAASDLACTIETQRRNDGWIIEGAATSAASAGASYRLTVSGEGRSGDLDISQSGDFGLRAGQAVRAGTVVLGHRDGTLVATLEVRSGAQRASCSKRLDLR